MTGANNPVWLDWFFTFGALVMAVCAIAGLGVLAHQIVGWLHYGTWAALPLRDFIHIDPSGLEWFGARKFVAAVLNLPLAGTLIIAPFFAFMLLFLMLEQLSKPK